MYNKICTAWSVVHIYNYSTWEAETGGLLRDWGQSGLHSEFKTILNYIARPYLKEKKKKNLCFEVVYLLSLGKIYNSVTIATFKVEYFCHPDGSLVLIEA